MDKKISPLKAKLLHQLGQSAQESIDKLVDERGASYIHGPVIFILVVAAL